MLLSCRGPNTDEVACFRVVFPRFPGRGIPDDERGLHPRCRVYLTNGFLVKHDKVDGPLHSTSAVAPLPEKDRCASLTTASTSRPVRSSAKKSEPP